MKPFLENDNVNELELIQEYMDIHGIDDCQKLTEKDYEIIEESKIRPDNNMEIIYIHMLKYKFQPSSQEQNKSSWMSSIRNCRDKLAADFDSPNKLSKLDDVNNLQKYYYKAVHDNEFLKGTGFSPKDLPTNVEDAFGDMAYPSNIFDHDKFGEEFIKPYAFGHHGEENKKLWDTKFKYKKEIK